MVCVRGAVLKAPSVLLSASKRVNIFVGENPSSRLSGILIFKRHNQTKSALNIDKPFGYYEVLGLKVSAKQSDVKQAYIKQAKLYHPDVNQSEHAKENFEKITEAYTTLMDLTQRYFYDQHGHPADFLKKKGSETIFDWKPKYGIYEESAEARKKEVEDWFSAQGHSTTQPRITLRQVFKNAFVELKFGFNYYNFPWNWDIFFLSVAGWAVFLYVFREGVLYVIRNVTYNPPQLAGVNNENRDMLWFTGLRKTNVSSQTNQATGSAGFYQNPKPGKIPFIKSAQVKPNVERLSTKERNKRRLERLQIWEEERHMLRMEEIKRMKDKQILKDRVIIKPKSVSSDKKIRKQTRKIKNKTKSTRILKLE